jgi:hypothetical protein
MDQESFAALFVHLKMQDVLIEQMSREMDLVAEVVMTISARMDWMEEDVTAHAQEAECKLDAAFAEIEGLRDLQGRAARMHAARRARLRRLGGPPPL